MFFKETISEQSSEKCMLMLWITLSLLNIEKLQNEYLLVNVRNVSSCLIVNICFYILYIVLNKNSINLTLCELKIQNCTSEYANFHFHKLPQKQEKM